MSERPDIVDDLASRVADGLPVDWDAALQGAPSDAERRVVQQLQLMQTVSRVQAAEPVSGEAASAPSTFVPPLTRWGHLQIREKLSGGSYGEVYRAWDPHLEREVALKLLRAPATSATVVEEGRLLAKLHHPNVVAVYGADTCDGRIGVWMEFIRGRSLEQWLHDDGLMGAREAALIGIDLCRALAAVHGTGIIHRDVKAQNVMRELGGRIVLMDFGAGVETRPDSDGDGGRITGTPFYMAPELLRGGPATQASELYSLGVLLYRLVTGRFPVDAKSWAALREHHNRGEPALLRDVRADLPEGFVTVVERAMAAEPGQRFATAGQMEQALAQGTSITQAPESTGSAATGGSRRPPWLLGVGVGLAVVVAAVLIAKSRNPRAGPERSTISVPSTSTMLKSAPASATPYSVEAAVYRVESRSGVRERLEPGARLALGDQLTLQFKGSTPLHVYIVNEDEAGHSYALFPLPGLDEHNPLTPGSVHVLPGPRNGKPLSWTVDSPGGREHLLILASPSRLVDYEAEMNTLARPGQTAITLSDAARKQLRGLGRLSESAPVPTTPSASRLFDLAERLAAGSESVSGVWLRRIDLESPRR